MSRIKALGGEGILTDLDLKDFDEAERKLLEAFKKGPLTVQRMREVTGQDQADRRMRELRSDLALMGWTITPKRVSGRSFIYELRPLRAKRAEFSSLPKAIPSPIGTVLPAGNPLEQGSLWS